MMMMMLLMMLPVYEVEVEVEVRDKADYGCVVLLLARLPLVAQGLYWYV